MTVLRTSSNPFQRVYSTEVSQLHSYRWGGEEVGRRDSPRWSGQFLYQPRHLAAGNEADGESCKLIQAARNHQTTTAVELLQRFGHNCFMSLLFSRHLFSFGAFQLFPVPSQPAGTKRHD